MKQLFENLVELLGKSEDDPTFNQLLNELGELPSPNCGVRYCFERSGFCIIANRGLLCSLFVNLRISEQPAMLAKFVGDLPAGICTTDTLLDVRRRLNKERFVLMKSTEPHAGDAQASDTYKSSPFLWIFTGEQLNYRISSLTVILEKPFETAESNFSVRGQLDSAHRPKRARRPSRHK